MIRSIHFKFLFLVLTTTALEAQTDLIHNGGFEQYTYDSGWFFNADQFNQLFYRWKSPTVASPDFYGPRIKVPDKWKDLSFGDIPNSEHNHAIGLTIYGCQKGKVHCREYITTSLIATNDSSDLVVFSFDFYRLPFSVKIKHIEVGFSLEWPADHKINTQMKAIHRCVLPESSISEWTKIVDTFHVPSDFRKYLTIGNFEVDKQTDIYLSSNRKLPFAYVYLDNIFLRTISRSNEIDFGKWLPLEYDKTISLPNIFFDFDSDTSRAESMPIIHKLIAFMKAYPDLRIKISGHTDDVGNATYNLHLSRRRALHVYQKLIDGGIAQERLEWEGKGETAPLSRGKSEKERKLNRRIDFSILDF